MLVSIYYRFAEGFFFSIACNYTLNWLDTDTD